MTIFLVHNEILLLHSVSNTHCICILLRILLCSLLIIHQQQPHLLYQVVAYNSHYFLKKRGYFKINMIYNNLMIPYNYSYYCTLLFIVYSLRQLFSKFSRNEKNAIQTKYFKNLCSKNNSKRFA